MRRWPDIYWWAQAYAAFCMTFGLLVLGWCVYLAYTLR